MFALFRFSQSATRFSHHLSTFPAVTRSFPYKNTLNCGFHTTKPRAAIPPVALVILRPVLRVVAFIAGRNFRKWWRALPKEKREYYWSRIKEEKWNLAGNHIKCIIVCKV